jgi:hypothetical protein
MEIKVNRLSWYFNSINARNYTLTWSLLSDRNKEHVNGPSQGGSTPIPSAIPAD